MVLEEDIFGIGVEEPGQRERRKKEVWARNVIDKMEELAGELWQKIVEYIASKAKKTNPNIDQDEAMLNFIVDQQRFEDIFEPDIDRVAKRILDNNIKPFLK